MRDPALNKRVLFRPQNDRLFDRVAAESDATLSARDCQPLQEL